MTKIYLIGGAVRDKIMGISCKDHDYAVESESFDTMREYIIGIGGEIFLETPQFLTIRARIGKETADYVMCRKDGEYTDGRRPDTVIPGTIYDDLARRDFRMNAIAISENGEYIDPFNGIMDIKDKIINCVGNPFDRFNEDALRMLRAIRFSVTKQFKISNSVHTALNSVELLAKFATSVSKDRVKDELVKMFQYDTLASLDILSQYPLFRTVIFRMADNGIWLKPTLEKR